MPGEGIKLEDLQVVSKLVKEIDQRVSDAVKVSQDVGLTQVARILETVKSYIDLLKRELDVEP